MTQWKDNLNKAFEDYDRWSYNEESRVLRDTKHHLEFTVVFNGYSNSFYLKFRDKTVQVYSAKLGILLDHLKQRNLVVELAPLIEAYGGE